MFNFIKNIFSDDLGNLSSMRVVTMLIVGVVLFNWTYINIVTGVLNPLDWNSVLLMLGGIAGKVAQKSVEEKIEKQC